MKNLYNIVKAFETVCNAHPQIHSFIYGDPQKVNSKQDNAYPLAVITSTPATIQKGIVDYSFEFTVVGEAEIDQNDLTDYYTTDSLLFDILFDVLGEVKKGITKINTTDREITLQDDISVNPIQATFNDKLNGWSANIIITVPKPMNGCSNSIINITNEGIGFMVIGTTFTIQ